MDLTPNLAMPLIASSQAQKHVTHNDALRFLDALVQLSVLDRDLAAPPATPADGDRFIVAAGASGAWAGQAGKIAARQDGAWAFFPPQTGWLAWVVDEALRLVFDGGAWRSAEPSLNPAALIGVNTSADTTNRLAVSAAASLFNHAGQGHQIKVNKQAAADTASLLYQTGFSGRAELGLSGDDHLAIKVSATGASWSEAFAVNPANGYLGLGGMRNASARLHLSENQANTLEALTLQNSSGAATAHLMARFYNDTGQAGLLMNSSTRTSDGGPGGFTLFNDAGTLNFRGAGAIRLHSSSGAVTPTFDNANTLGSASVRWSAVWAANGTIQTSDAREKAMIGSLADFSVELVEAVDPVLFRWLDGGAQESEIDATTAPADAVRHARPGRRAHAGMMAQELKRAMDDAGVDFGAWGLEDKRDPDSRQWIRPDQLVYVLWSALRRTRQELAAVTARVRGMEDR